MGAIRPALFIRRLLPGAIRPALADVFDSADYQPDERLSGLDIDPMQLLLHQDYHYVDGCDKITATYHGVSVLLGNVRLMDTDCLLYTSPSPRDA